MRTLPEEDTATVPLVRRRLLTGVVALGLAGYVAGSLAGAPLVTLAALAAVGASWWYLRRAIGTVADLPDEQLDERQVSLRDRAYLSSYRLVGGLVGLLVVATVAWDALDVDEVSTVHVQTAGGALLFLMVVLPTCIVAWSERGG